MLHVEIMVNGAKFDFYNESRNTRNGFAHDTKVYVNGLYSGKTSCFYLNRTWEKYRYQSVMMEWVYKEKQERRALNKAQFLHEHGYQRMTAARIPLYDEWEKHDEYMKTLAMLKNELEKNCY